MFVVLSFQACVARLLSQVNAFSKQKTSDTLVFFIELHFIQCSTENLSLPLNLSHSYDSEGRLTNVTFPTGVVTSLGYDMETVSTVERESFERDEAATMTTNQSAIQSVLALQQGNLFTLNGACVLWGIECTLENALMPNVNVLQTS